MGRVSVICLTGRGGMARQTGALTLYHLGSLRAAVREWFCLRRSQRSQCGIIIKENEESWVREVSTFACENT